MHPRNIFSVMRHLILSYFLAPISHPSPLSGSDELNLRTRAKSQGRELQGE